ncbi:metallophosphoesterase [Brevibacillus reuszeri]|uniref:metallophosphoesterase n=1 Tax=Brevibacillus reuszeri TaxID=54915 RepID=UPI0028A24DF9|nr:metallophosphoesterase [Brevibacillus reuszeri]
MVIALLVLACAGIGTAFCLIHTLFVKTTTISMSVPGVPRLTLVHLTDLHGRTRFLNGPLHRLVNRHHPDLVLVTGDLTQNSRQLDEVLMELSRVDKGYGIYFVPGNYEREEVRCFHKRLYSAEAYAENKKAWAKHMVVLENEGRLIPIGASQILIYGFDNSTYGNERYVWDDSAQASLTVFLAHSPNIITSIYHNGLKADLLLTGHTHGGQIRLFGKPLGGTAYRHFHLGQKKDEAVGLFSISRGLGTAKLPVRLFCFPEVTVYQINHHQPD